MSKVTQPRHGHTCLIRRGSYPCWEPDCVLPGHIVCEDCVKDREETLLAIISGSEVAAVRQVD